MSKQKIIVVGNGMVGHKFIENMIEHPDYDQYEVVTFSEEPRLAYDRVQLSYYFAGKTVDELMLTSPDYYDENGVRFIVSDKVVNIDHANKKVVTESGREESYDKLILATGSYPFVPPIPGKDQEHCLVYRTIEDLEGMTASAKVSKVGVVVGGGLLGLEAANALKNLGLETHVVEFAPRLMAVQLDEGGGQLLRSKIEELGVSVHTEKNTTEIVAGETCRYRMNFADGSHIETDMILFSAGIRPQDELARQFDIEIGPRGGIVIDNYCQTSAKDVYAIGECALWDGKIFGLVAPGYNMAKVAVSHITGGGLAFEGADMSTKLKLLGVDVASIGDAQARTPGCLSYTYADGHAGVYKRLVVSADNKKVIGAVLVGDVEAYGNLLQMMLGDIEIPGSPEALILPSIDGAAPALGVDALPDSAQICSCHDVTKGDIFEAVKGGCTDLAGIKSCTKAVTGCGGCAAMTTQVMNAALTEMGVEVDDSLCEHFSYTRQEIFDIIRVKGIKSFDELLESYGQGRGCEICKPAIGSMLATHWNEYVLDDKHIGLQDTNDVFLANMQRDGTYSVVPRIAGGEITPEQLIVLGEVGRDFGLYTKITGGQRIDFFGAQLHELPPIWERLVEAGFETGHAYGKSLRTVKSCVGSTWCRYGMLDSVSMAVNLEMRYKGLRSPHKLKMAVSGCTRECAEAQGKDVGVIATDKGWNLYLCGNGGMKPRHADLFAQDLDDETLLKYIDRFLMFYCRTADKLQRTSVWMDNLEGGLEYLHEVIVEDKLGICEELEADMQRVIDTYECEWKKTLNSPERLKRFAHFINSDLTDDNLAYVEMRGQAKGRIATDEERQKQAKGVEIETVELV
ncbi:putative NAD(P)H-nitrite reductase, large subunit [Catenovulum agarivorans DS-2]|uniref:Putative NAD(P)H-nitrite reductase, large subunit n=1 Tax=Catenovulum agarivorans DS-2 TaxID=1328313 RepID=W7R2W6_9ALTE|nr:nitrite reductase large subunit NirB [Catenovulum agarivorans]EWH11985.1 putative NAD(P)H-nitrite reductase, large subunit [Catenovulum agarivorans DS-2]